MRSDVRIGSATVPRQQADAKATARPQLADVPDCRYLARACAEGDLGSIVVITPRIDGNCVYANGPLDRSTEAYNHAMTNDGDLDSCIQAIGKNRPYPVPSKACRVIL
jgi:hypothetical protein